MSRFKPWVVSHPKVRCPAVLALVAVLEHVDLLLLHEHHPDGPPDRMKHHFVIEALDQVVQGVLANGFIAEVAMENPTEQR